MIYHGFPYQQPDTAWPGSFHFHGLVGTFISRHDAIWPWLRTVNLAVARGQYLMQKGQTIVDVALFDRNLEHQFESGRAEELATGVLDGIDREDSAQSALVSQAHPPRTEWQIMAEDSRRLGNALMEAGYDYIHINEERLLQAVLTEDGTLSVGKARLKVLILPAVPHLTLTAATRIRELIDQGFPVLFCDLVPDTVPGYLEYEKQSAELRSLLQNQKPTARQDLAPVMAQIGVRPGIQTDAPGLQHIHKKPGDLDLYLIRSRLPDSRMARCVCRSATARHVGWTLGPVKFHICLLKMMSMGPPLNYPWHLTDRPMCCWVRSRIFRLSMTINLCRPSERRSKGS